jgi:hypothetical protein
VTKANVEGLILSVAGLPRLPDAGQAPGDVSVGLDSMMRHMEAPDFHNINTGDERASE